MVTLDLGEERLEVTTSHPFWVVTGDDLLSRPRPAHVDDLSAPSQTTGRLVDGEHLRPGDFLLSKSGIVLRLESVANRDVAGLPVYNFTVGDLHCYAVMNCEVLVHNTEDCGPKGNKSHAPTTPGGRRLTSHAANDSLVRHRFKPPFGEVYDTINNAQWRVTQADGATMHINKALGRGRWYSFVIEGVEGIVTAMKDLKPHELRKLAAKYGFTMP